MNLTASDPFTGKIQLTNSDLLAFNTKLPTCCILINVIVCQYLNIVNTPCEVLVMCATGSLVAPSKQKKKSSKKVWNFVVENLRCKFLKNVLNSVQLLTCKFDTKIG